MFVVIKSGEILSFPNIEDAQIWCEGRGELYVIFEEFPKEEGYYAALSSLKVYEEPAENMICEKANCSGHCSHCPHTKIHKHLDTCDDFGNCYAAQCRVKCLPCQ